MLHKFADKRKHDRLQLNLKVCERESGGVLGLTENIHCEGMKLISVKPFKDGETIQVVIELPGEGENKKLVLTAQSCWSAPDNEPLVYNVGFRFLYSSPELKKYYETLFDGLGE